MAIIGIDLGTTNSLVTTFKDGEPLLIPNRFGEFLTPSVVSVDDEGKILVGKIAKERLVSSPERTTALFKRDMGTDKEVYLGEKGYKPEELSSFVIRQLLEDAKAFLGEPIEEAVISVPAYFDAKQRAATKLAGNLAGVKVERLVNEPSSAALACHDSKDDEMFIVFDFGGGTLDVSIVECFDNVINICAVAGDNHLGGRDFDEAIVEAFCKENNKLAIELSNGTKRMLLRMAEKAKIELGEKEEVKLTATVEDKKWNMTLTNDKLFEISGHIFKRLRKPIRNAINDSGLQASDIDKCVLVGGSCHMEVVREYLKGMLSLPVVNASDIDQIVARGLGIYTGIKMRDPQVKSLVLTDICPFSLGIDIHNHDDMSKPLMSTLIKRNTVLPASKAHIYQTVDLAQTEVNINAYQGENLYAKDNLLLDNLVLKVPKNKKEHEQFQVVFSYDINAILVVEVTVLSTKEKKVMVLGTEGLSAKDIDLQQYVLKIQKEQLRLSNNDNYELLLEKAKRVYTEADDELREKLSYVVMQCEQLKDIGSMIKRNQEIARFHQLLDKIENNMDQNDIFLDNNKRHGLLLENVKKLYCLVPEHLKEKAETLLLECESLPQRVNELQMRKELERLQTIFDQLEREAGEGKGMFGSDTWLS